MNSMIKKLRMMTLHECTMKLQDWTTETTNLMEVWMIQTVKMMIMMNKPMMQTKTITNTMENTVMITMKKQ